MIGDELAISRIIIRYVLAVDAGEAEATASMFTEDAVFDVDSDNIMRGNHAVAEKVLGSQHHALLPNCAHTIGPFVVDLSLIHI